MRLLHLKTQVDKTLSELVWTQHWHRALHKVGLDGLLRSFTTGIILIYLATQKYMFFSACKSLNEIKIRIKHHSKNLFYESSRIWFKHKIKMHSILVFICQEVINMQSRIYKRLSKTSFFLSKQLKKMIFVINQQIFLQILLTVPC